MEIKLIDPEAFSTFYPLCTQQPLSQQIVAGLPLKQIILQQYRTIAHAFKPEVQIQASTQLFPTAELLEALQNTHTNADWSYQGEIYLTLNLHEKLHTEHFELQSPHLIQYPWDLIELNSQLIGAMHTSNLAGEVRSGAHIDGFLQLGHNSVILPGVYIEGNVIIGDNCKIGPNCYIRGNTYIGDSCHIGQSCEIKNSLIMNGVSVGHLSYIGDSFIGESTNCGAGTITANLRHDNLNQSFKLQSGEMVETGRRKLGAIIGSHVHTGIHTAIYPGRMITNNALTKPGEVVSKNILD